MMPFSLRMEHRCQRFSILRMLGTSSLLSRKWAFQLLKHLILSKYVVCLGIIRLVLNLFHNCSAHECASLFFSLSREEKLLVLSIAFWQLNRTMNGNKVVELEFGNLVVA